MFRTVFRNAVLHRSCVWPIALLAVFAASWAPNPLCARPDDQAVPFKGSAVGMVTDFVPPNEFIIDYTGTATHLGRFTREEHLFLNADGSFTGTMVFTAANGDELWLTFRGAFTSPTNGEGTYTFTGGTGRFRDATGQATFEAYTPDLVHVEATFEGTIRY